jgi:hypothetical protein
MPVPPQNRSDTIRPSVQIAAAAIGFGVPITGAAERISDTIARFAHVGVT